MAIISEISTSALFRTYSDPRSPRRMFGRRDCPGKNTIDDRKMLTWSVLPLVTIIDPHISLVTTRPPYLINRGFFNGRKKMTRLVSLFLAEMNDRDCDFCPFYQILCTPTFTTLLNYTENPEFDGENVLRGSNGIGPTCSGLRLLGPFTLFIDCVF